MSPRDAVLNFGAARHPLRIRQRGPLQVRSVPVHAQPDVVGLGTQLEKHERQRLQLFHVEDAQVLCAAQHDQRGELKKGTKGSHRAPHQAEECREHGDAPAHRLEQLIEEQRHGDVAGACEEVGCETQPKQRLVRPDAGRRGRGVAVVDEPPAKSEGRHSANEGEQVEDTRDPGVETQRGFAGRRHQTLQESDHPAAGFNVREDRRISSPPSGACYRLKLSPAGPFRGR